MQQLQQELELLASGIEPAEEKHLPQEQANAFNYRSGRSYGANTPSRENRQRKDYLA